MLTNEDMFELVKDGNEDLKPVLWDRVKNLLYMFAGKYYRQYTEYCCRCGVTEWDLKQQAYTAYVNSFASYDRSPGAYAAYLNLMFRNAIRGLFGGKDPLNFSDSLDRLLDTEDEGGGTVGDLVPDTAAAEAFKEIEDNSVAAVVRSAVEKLPDRERDIIKSRYFDGLSRPRISADMGVSPAKVHQIEATALNRLHKNRDIRRFGDELGYSSQRAYHNTVRSFKRYGMSGVERVAIERADITISEQERFMCYEKARERLLSGGSFEEYERTISEFDYL